MIAIWSRIPLPVRAVGGGLLLASLVTAPWALLASANVSHAPKVPWATPPTALYLWLWWQYVSGRRGWPRSTAAARQALLRAVPVREDLWAASVPAGALGLMTAVLINNVVQRLVSHSPPIPDAGDAPAWTVLCLLVTGAAVAGIVEEASFRGYMQSALERRYRPAVAIGVTAGAFALAHSGNPQFSASQLPFYACVGTTFCALAYLTQSILPGMAVHVTAVLLDGLGQLARISSATGPTPTVWETGVDASFVLSCIGVVAAGAGAIWAYAALANVAHQPLSPAPESR